MKRSFLLLMSALAIVSCGLFPEMSREEKSALAAKTAKAYKTCDLKIAVSNIYPGGGGSVFSNGDYTLELKDGKATANLPFFGESHTSVIAGIDDPGVKLDGCPVSVKKDKSSKGGDTEYTLRFRATSGHTEWDVVIEFWQNGSASIRCISSDRSPMSYSGDLVFEE